MKVGLLCEFSGVVRDAFRAKGHDARSVDLLPSERPGPHTQGDAIRWLERNAHRYDILLAFPPCTDLASSGARWFKEKRADGRQQRAITFVTTVVRLMRHARVGCGFENPIGVLSTVYRPPDQIVQPWMFGHGETKATCLWLYGLPPLTPTHVVDGRHGRVWREPPGPDRWKNRSRTYPGLADAMAAQWGLTTASK